MALQVACEATAAHSTVQARWPRRVDLQLNGRHGRPGAGSVIPASAMNPAFEYCLPRHLALLQSNPPPSHSCSYASFQDAEHECGCGVPKTDGTGIPGTSRACWPDEDHDTEDSMLPMPPGGTTSQSFYNLHASGEAGTFSSVHTTAQQTHVTGGMQDDHPTRNHCNHALAPVPCRAKTDCTHTSHGDSSGLVRAASEDDGGPNSCLPSRQCTAIITPDQPTHVGSAETARDTYSGCSFSAESTTELTSSVAFNCELACGWAGCEDAASYSNADGYGCTAVADSVEESQRRNACMHGLQMQLDLFRAEDVFLGRFHMLGREQRRRGGAMTKPWLSRTGCTWICTIWSYCLFQ